MLDEAVEYPGKHVLYYLHGGTDRGFVREKLMLIPEDTQIPLEQSSKWR